MIAHTEPGRTNVWRDTPQGLTLLATQSLRKYHAERPSWYADTYAPNVRVAAGNHAYYSNESARRVAAYVNIPGAVYGHYSIYGLPERYSCYANALVVLADTPVFPSAEKGKSPTDVPEGFVLRQPW